MPRRAFRVTVEVALRRSINRTLSDCCFLPCTSVPSVESQFSFRGETDQLIDVVEH
jgi:hypothetical protein